jgi:MFS family permease
MAVNYGWRMGILATSLPVFIGCFILWFLVEEKPRENPNRNSYTRIEEHSSKLSYTEPALISIAYMGHMWELYAFWGWIGPFMVASVSSAGIASSAATTLGNQLAALIVLVGVPAVWLWGIAADKIGRIKAIIMASIFSLIPQFFFGYLVGQAPLNLMAFGLWIGFWVVADSAIYKASLTEMVPSKMRATMLGVQSAFGFGMTALAPAVFGQILEYYNGGVPPTDAAIWGPSFFVLGIGALLSPIATIILAKMQRSKRQGAQ